VTDATARTSPLTGEAAAVAAVIALNIALNRVSRRWELPAGGGAAALMTGIATAAGANVASEGLDPANARRGLLLGLAVGVPAAGLVMAASLVPGVRRFYQDERVVDATSSDIAYHLFARIPFATAMVEEVIFRSALIGVFARSRSPFAAAALSSALFGAWHILPTVDRLRSNPGASGAHTHDARVQALGIAAVVAATGIAGMGFCWLQRKSGSVVAPIVVHGALNGAGLLAGWLGRRRVIDGAAEDVV
jgi:membrane protease YdiL (CAAX protease family)